MRSVSHQPIYGEIRLSKNYKPVPELPSPSFRLPDSETHKQLRELGDSDIADSPSTNGVSKSYHRGRNIIPGVVKNSSETEGQTLPGGGLLHHHGSRNRSVWPPLALRSSQHFRVSCRSIANLPQQYSSFFYDNRHSDIRLEDAKLSKPNYSSAFRGVNVKPLNRFERDSGGTSPQQLNITYRQKV